MSYWCQKKHDPCDERSVLQLITAIKYLSWDDISDRLREHPDEASESDKFDLTPLFHAIRKRHCAVPIHVIRALIKAHPASLLITDKQTGNNALHIACMNSVEGVTDNSNDNIAAMIIDANPDGAKHVCNGGEIPLHRAKDVGVAKKIIEAYPRGLGIATKSNKYLPLHSACSDNTVPPDVVNILIESARKQKVGKQCGSQHCGGVLVKDIYGEIPLKMMFRRVLFSSKSTSNGLQIDKQTFLWEKLCLVAKATYLAVEKFPRGWQSQSTPLVHSFIEFSGNPSIVEYALKLHPDEAITKDKRGMTPLVVAARKVNTLREIFQLLLKIPAVDAMKGHGGRLPLHLALSSGRTWNNGVALIAEAAPPALQVRDVKTNLYPFMLAAVPTFGWDNTSIDTIYTILRDAPSVMQALCPISPN